MPPLRPKVLICGDGAVGKKMKEGDSMGWSDEYVPTLACNEMLEIGPVDDLAGNSWDLTLDLWDTAGQENLANIRKDAYAGTQILLVAFEMTSRESLNNVQSCWMPEFWAECSEPWAVVLVGTKHDLWEQSQASEGIPTLAEAQAVAEQIGAEAFISTSAKTGYGVGYVDTHCSYKSEHPGIADNVLLNVIGSLSVTHGTGAEPKTKLAPAKPEPAPAKPGPKPTSKTEPQKESGCCLVQ